MIHFEKKIKYTALLSLSKEVRLIKNTALEQSNTYQKLYLEASWFAYQRELLNLLLCSVEKILHSSAIVTINLSCVKPSQFRR